MWFESDDCSRVAINVERGCRISDAHDTLSGSFFAWVHTATEDLPPPGLYPTGKQTVEVQAAMCSTGCIGAICNQAAEPHANAHMFKLA